MLSFNAGGNSTQVEFSHVNGLLDNIGFNSRPIGKLGFLDEKVDAKRRLLSCVVMTASLHYFLKCRFLALHCGAKKIRFRIT